MNARVARMKARYLGDIITRRGNVPRPIAPLRAFYKRVARRAERREGRAIDLAEMIDDARCDGCGRAECLDVWCGMHRDVDDEAVYAGLVPDGFDDGDDAARCIGFWTGCACDACAWRHGRADDFYDDCDGGWR